MNEQTDSQLLRDYTQSHSEAAFSELVRRHLDFVYSAALRMVCDPHLAEDVTQSVFTALARNASQLSERLVISSWLHRTAQNIAAQTVRTIERRRAREQEAAAMNDLLAAEPDARWEHIAPHLDVALGKLSGPDRDAVMLRYFERKSARQIAQILGTSDDAAQKRVSRAVERLRELFAKRGVTIGASSLAVVLSANAIQAAPIGLSAAITTAVATLATATTTTTLATATTMNWLNIKSIAAIVTAALTAGTATHFVQQHEAARLRDENQQLVTERDQLAGERDAALAGGAAEKNELARLQKNQLELLRLRGEAGLLRGQITDLEKLREQNRRLQEGLAKAGQLLEAGGTESESDPQKAALMEKLNLAKEYGLAFHMYLQDDNQPRLPTNFGQIAEYLGGKNANPSFSDLTNQFEIVIHGS